MKNHPLTLIDLRFPLSFLFFNKVKYLLFALPEPLLSEEEDVMIPRGNNNFSQDEDDEAIQEIFSREDSRMKNPSASDVSTTSQEITYEIQDVRPTSLSFWRACLLPGVIPVCSIHTSFA